MAQASSGPASVERHLLRVLVAIAAVAVVGVLTIVPWRLYSRDVRLAEVDAHRVGSLLHVALSHELQHGGDAQDVADLVNRFQGIAALEIRLRQLEPGEIQPESASGRGSSERHDTDLTYTAPPILDTQGQTWLATMHFDLSPMKRESMRLIIDLVFAVMLGSAAFSAAVYLLIRRSLLQPLHEVTRRVETFAAGRELGPTPAFESRELQTLMDALDRARHVKVGG
jgi:hypothetical protein